MKPAHASSPLYSIVIPTKNGGELFKEAIERLKVQKLWQQSELIVIDSGSKDGTVDIARASGAKVFEIPPGEYNHGATRDLGITHSSCEHVILMVQDAIPQDADLLGNILRPFEDPEVAGVYARQLPQPDADLLTKRNLNNWLTGRIDGEVRKMSSLEWYESLLPMDKYFFGFFYNVGSAIRKCLC